jgi:hypothetical protein
MHSLCTEKVLKCLKLCYPILLPLKTPSDFPYNLQSNILCLKDIIFKEVKCSQHQSSTNTSQQYQNHTVFIPGFFCYHTDSRLLVRHSFGDQRDKGGATQEIKDPMQAGTFLWNSTEHLQLTAAEC